MVIDNHYIALKLVEGLFRKGLVNSETFENVKATYPEAFASSGDSYWEHQLKQNVKDGK